MTAKIEYEKVLNPAQLEAVMALDGPILVIAGAGSGKTRTLIYRVAHLVETGVPPEAILLLTFTRKASREMLDRAAALSDARCKFVSGGTFHSLAHRVLRNHSDLLGYKNTFTILDRSDMEAVIHSLVAELQAPKGATRFPKRSTLANILSKSANVQCAIEDLMIEEYGQFIQFIPQMNKLQGRYIGYKKAHNMMDYDDLILNLRKLLQDNEAVRENLSRQYAYVMVDEYQDTNAIQADIVRWLAHSHRNIMVVGDDAQSIYSFRGANYRNMFDFQDLFPGTKTIKLEENYRSTQPILQLTNALMDRANEKFTKCLFTERKGGELPRVIDTKTELGQAVFVVQAIKKYIQQGYPISDLAVLFRAGYHSFELEAELTRQGIKYVKYGGFKFLESAHIKDFLAHLRVLVNIDDAVSWVRILRLIKKVGLVKSQSIIDWMKTNNIPPERIGEWPGESKNNGLKPLAKLLNHLVSKKMAPESAVEQVLEYYLPILKEKFDDYPRRQKELEQLIPMSSRYKKIRGFLDDLVLEPPTSSADMESGDREKSLTLSTIHSAKGLEWSVVLILWVMEGKFPPSRAYNKPADLEEERRLMYVAATRAKDQLIMCYPGDEWVPSWSAYDGAMNSFGGGLSSFIEGLPEEVISIGSSGTKKIVSGSEWRQKEDQTLRRGRRKSVSMWDTQVKANATGLLQGDRVKHPAFGAGVVSQLVDDEKVEVIFKEVGRKLLHMSYTTLEKT